MRVQDTLCVRGEEALVRLGAGDEIIQAAEKDMGLCFPEGLKMVWRLSNGLELPGGWRLFPVFDPKEPQKTCNHVGYENTKGRWPYMDESLLSIAADDSGNQLVLKRDGTVCLDTIFHWNHETNRIRKWGKGFDYLLAKAQGRVTKIEKQIVKSLGKRRS